VLEDFLCPNGLTLDDYCSDFTGSWIFGYADTLRTAGVRPVIVCFAGGVRAVTRRVHGATGTDICVIPVPRAYRLLRARMQVPYGRTVAQTFGVSRPARLALYPLLFATKELAPFLATSVRALARELRRYRCGALLCQEYEFPRFDVCVAWGRLRGVPVYATFQGGDYQRWRLERLTRPAAMRLASGVIAASEVEAERLVRRYGRVRTARIANPIDLDVWQPGDRDAARRALGIDRDAHVAAWHGRVQLRKKGLDTLLDAWAQISANGREGAERTLLLIGSGVDAAELRRRLSESGLENVVWVDHYLHDRAEIARLLAAADVYAFPSRHEGFPLAPIEAMACGLPVVSADVSGIRDVLVEGESSGGVVVPGDAPEWFANELERLLADPALCQKLGYLARERAEGFGSAAVGAQLRAFLFPETAAPAGAAVTRSGPSA
jgi:glycosyltransferase involved in cell wall biosynthesis